MQSNRFLRLPKPGEASSIGAPAMAAVIRKGKHDELFRGITDILGQWPDLDRKVFTRAHYRGESIAAISRSLRVDARQVRGILEKCEQDLHASLRMFRGNAAARAAAEETGGQADPRPEAARAHQAPGDAAGPGGTTPGARR